MDLPRLKRPLRYAMALFYVVAGVSHFLAPRAFERAVPPAFPRPRALVHLSGVAEILLGVGVLFERTRRLSAWGLVALLAAVFPANVHIARGGLDDTVPDAVAGLVRAAGWARLPLQPVLMAWAWWYTRE
ncbi:MauE/DoxX family redox-associated membrane protein [Halosegnis marinus]|uniref:MauE/DoxX family redox-associated membrane protein n=1 Tax=Halosegnis marinus TaxID=3034023 RepID=A0ABD5ZNQ3_9EURY|nr:MauE/DoxX family redox-associated membrane protein [Halosegnis sp. DT85]